MPDKPDTILLAPGDWLHGFYVVDIWNGRVLIAADANYEFSRDEIEEWAAQLRKKRRLEDRRACLKRKNS